MLAFVCERYGFTPAEFMALTYPQFLALYRRANANPPGDALNDPAGV